MNELVELSDYYDPSAVDERGEDVDDANRLLEEGTQRINEELAELERTDSLNLINTKTA